MAGQNGLLFSKVPRHRSAVYLRIEQSSQLKQEFFIIFQCPLDGEQFTLAVGSVKPGQYFTFLALLCGFRFQGIIHYRRISLDTLVIDSSSAYWAATFSPGCPGMNDCFPNMAVRTLPPNLFMTPYSHHFRRQRII